MKILIVCNDAGGSEIISSYIKRNKKNKYTYVLSGPAIKIFKKKNQIACYDNSFLNIDKCDLVLCGTSWNSDLEIEAIKIAKVKKIKSVAFLDHWVNYSERFIRGKKKIYPDELWVGDLYARNIAKKKFPKIPIKLIKNPYLADLKYEFITKFQDKTKNCNKKNQLNLLYLTSPIAEHALKVYNNSRYYGYDEFDAIKIFLNNVSKAFRDLNSIIIRCHPSENKDKYYFLKSQYPFLNLKFTFKTELLKDIASSDIIVGGSSMAMVVGLMCKKRVISFIPHNLHKCTLPFSNIENFYSLV